MVPYQVTFDSLDVTAIDDGLFGGDLETRWVFQANGIPVSYDNDDLDVGITPLGLSVRFDVPSQAEDPGNRAFINIKSSGREIDDVSDDQLPRVDKTWYRSEGFGVGHQEGFAENAYITYTLNFTITELSRVVTFISRTALTGYPRERAKRRNVEITTNESILVVWSLNRLLRAGWTVVSEAGDGYMLSGFGDLPLTLEQRFGLSSQ